MQVKNAWIAAAVMTVALTATAQTTDKKTRNLGPAAVPTQNATAVENLRTAAALARYGDANKDALALITAARLVRDAGATTTPTQPVKAGPRTQEAADKNAGADTLTVAALVQRAKAVANGRPDLIALADEVGQTTTRGATVGARIWTEMVPRRSNHDYRIAFRGGELARVLVSGDGDSDLDLYIYDENGNLICKDDDATDDMICSFTPRWTGNFTVRVRNLGISNLYRIAHN